MATTKDCPHMNLLIPKEHLPGKGSLNCLDCGTQIHKNSPHHCRSIVDTFERGGKTIWFADCTICGVRNYESEEQPTCACEGCGHCKKK